MNPIALRNAWREQTYKHNGPLAKTNYIFNLMKRLKKNDFKVLHRGRSHEESERVWKCHDILPLNCYEFKFEMFDKSTGKKTPNTSLVEYFKKRYDLRLNSPELPVVQTTKKNVVFPMELCYMNPGQRYPYKLNELQVCCSMYLLMMQSNFDLQTSAMIKFAVQRPEGRMAGIKDGLDMLDWKGDDYLKHYGLEINRDPIKTQARILPAPEVLFKDGKTVKPGYSGRWDLRGQKFLKPNTAPLVSWGVAVIAGGLPQHQPQEAQVRAFVNKFIETYRGHGGTVQTTSPIVQKGVADVAKAVENLFFAVGNKHNVRPQILIFVLPSKLVDTYLRIKKSCDCRYGVQSQCVQSQHLVKNAPQYHSNVLMKVNAKLGGTTCNAKAPKGPNGFPRPTLVIGADVSHAAPGILAPSYAAMTVSMDREAARYAAGVQTNGHRVEMIATRNLREMLLPLIRNWMQTVSGGRLPDHVYYFRDGVSEGQFTNVLKYEVGDMKEIFAELGETRKDFQVGKACPGTRGS